MKSFARIASIVAAASTCAGALFACSDDELTTPPPTTSSSSASSSSSGGTPAEGGTSSGDTGTPQKPLYALGTLIFSQTSSTTYVELLGSLDTQADVTTAQAREFPGYAAATATNGKLLVNDGETPKITRFAIGDDNATWTEEASLNFSSFSQSSLTASILVNGTTAYAPFDALSYVAWNPATFQLGAELADPAAIPLTRDGLNVTRGYAHIVAGDLAYQTFYWTNTSYSAMSATSQIGILDSKTNAWVGAPEVPCPHMHIATKDDAGNLWFSPGQYSIAAAVVDPAAPKNCMAKIAAGATTLDPANVVKFSDLTAGREGSNFFYVGNGIGFFNVYHAERDGTGTGSDPSKIQYSANYHLWTYNLTTKAAAIMEGVDYAGGQYTSFSIDGKVYVAIPAADYSSTTVYEITSAGKAERRFATQGWTFNMFKVR